MRADVQPQRAQGSQLVPADPIGQMAVTIVRDAATRQGGIAQLYADLEASFAPPKVDEPARDKDIRRFRTC